MLEKDKFSDEEDAESNFSFAKSDVLDIAQKEETGTQSENNRNRQPKQQEKVNNSSLKYEGLLRFYSANDKKQNVRESNKINQSDSRVPSNSSLPEVPSKKGSPTSSVTELVDSPEVARSVSMTMVNQKQSPVNKKYFSRSISPDDSNESFQPAALVTENVSREKTGPGVSYETTIEGSIPPRSSRRPRSAILSNEKLNPGLKKKLSKKFLKLRHKSLSLDEDLEKIMDSASSMSEKAFLFDGNELQELSKEASRPTEETALTTGAGYSLTQESKSERKRQSNDTLNARVERNRDSHDSNYENGSSPRSHIDSYDSSSPLMKKAPAFHINTSSDTWSSDDETKGHLVNSSRQRIPPRPTPESMKRAREVSNKVAQKQTVEGAEGEWVDDQQKPRSLKLSNSRNDDALDLLEKESLFKDERFPQMKKASSRKARRGKKSGKRESLKPFSYTTLINLLESTNGTIIGEEFGQLNLPMKEKQLLEKIVDSLSRLTLDMLMDESRYEVGITRLEKALKAIEGFM